jgi:hypothetical protein
MPLVAPGLPQNSGGNDPARSAALGRLGNSQSGVTDPNQLPRGQAGAGPMVGASGREISPVAQLLSQAATLFVQRQGQPEDIEAIKGFLAFVQELAESSAGAPQGQAVPPGVGAGPLPQMSAQGAPGPVRA